ncbi:AzlC family ABC transporter permease [Algirhabdus cladophorae]|uniref:AzlC family ABC transporter permease n=1 Tax=Algirhabdus cladophorae TaxID=3377108 RepID=UPI003B8471AD
MAATNPKTIYWRGVLDGSPFILVLIPFGMLFGVAATEAGLNLAQVMGFSILVIAGSAQFTALQLMTENAPTIIVVLTALSVNLRMAMYSVAMVPHLGAAPLWKRALASYLLVDQSYTVAYITYEKNTWSLRQKLAYFWGVLTPMAPLWYGATYLGAVLGSAIPPEYALDFAVPITFLALIAPSLKSLAHVAAAFVSAAGTLALIWVPYSLGLMIAAFFALIVGARVEVWMERQHR